MKKFNFIFCGLLVAFEVMKVSFVSTASGFQPPMLPSSSADTAVTAFTNSLLMKGAESLGIQFKVVDDLKNAVTLMTGNSIEPNFTHEYMSGDIIAEYFDELGVSLFNANGDVVDVHDATICISKDGNLFSTSTFIYDNTTGDILKIGTSSANAVSSVQGGLTPFGIGTITDTVDPILSGKSDQIYNPAELTPAQREYVENNTFGGYMLSLDHSFVCYVPNGCSADSIIVKPSGGTPYIYNGYSASSGGQLSAFTFNCTLDGQNTIYIKPAKLGGYLNIGTFKTNNSSYYGKVWGYTAEWANAKNPMYFGGWIYYHAPTQAEYNNFVGLGDFSDKVVDAQVVEPTDTPDVIGGEKANLTVTRNYTINNEYDYSKPTTINNYPFNVTNTSVPDYNPTYNYYSFVQDYYNSPNTGDEIGVIPDANIPSNIPILNNLEKRFPFSIPFDIYNLLQSLNDERITPFIDETVVIPVVDYEWHIQYDLSDFDDVANLFRTLFLISFIIGLAYFSYDHFFGS